MGFTMTVYGVLFYLLAVSIVLSTAMAITRRHAVHAVVYLVISFFGTALLFYLLGAPLIAAFEVIIYAGAIMVLFLFIIMMLKLEPAQRRMASYIWQWVPAILLGGMTLALAALMIIMNPVSQAPLHATTASPSELGRFLFHHYWFPVEIVSFLLFVALVGALYLGRREHASGKDHTGDEP